MRYIRDQTAYVLLAQVGVTSLFITLYVRNLSLKGYILFLMMRFEMTDFFFQYYSFSLISMANPLW